MNTKRLVLLPALIFLALVATLISSRATKAMIPAGLYAVRYWVPQAGAWVVATVDKEDYVANTLPNEWIASWDQETLKAGAVIIRSGAYWRQHRSYLGSQQPNNNCYSSQPYVPQRYHPYGFYFSTGGITGGNGGATEQYRYGSAMNSASIATASTYQFHGEFFPTPTGRPDALIMLAYNNLIQYGTLNASGVWAEKIRAAYGSSVNGICQQTDSLDSLSPAYINF